jgi:hypothetical protein
MTGVDLVFPIWWRRDWHNAKPLRSEGRREAEHDLPFFLLGLPQASVSPRLTRTRTSTANAASAQHPCQSSLRIAQHSLYNPPYLSE